MAKRSGPQLPEPWDQLTLQALMTKGAMTSPARVFLRDCPDREACNGMEPRTLTFDAFFKASHFLAAQLKTLGVEPGDRVLILLPGATPGSVGALSRRGVPPPTGVSGMLFVTTRSSGISWFSSASSTSVDIPRSARSIANGASPKPVT